MKILNKRIIHIAGAALLASGCTAMARDLTIASWGGTYTEKQRAAIIQPFSSETGINVLDATFTGGLGQIRAMVEANNTTWDLVQVDSYDLISGCAEGLFQPIDRSKFKHLAEYPPQLISECGIGASISSVVIGYNTKATGDQPKTWSDFWDLKKYPGKRALRRSPQWALEAALMADGVPQSEVYKVLATPQGVERAFAKLDDIKSSIVWWESGSQPAEWLASGNVVMSSSYVGRLLEAQAQKAPVAFGWRDGVYLAGFWGLISGSSNVDQSYAFMDYASAAKPQAAFSTIQPIAPVNVKAIDYLDPKRIEIMPVGHNLEGQLFIDGNFWVDHNESLTERFNSWIAK